MDKIKDTPERVEDVAGCFDRHDFERYIDPEEAQAMLRRYAFVIPDLEKAANWERAARNAGVCTTCIHGPPDPYGCSDCLNTGWEQGGPAGYVEEARLRDLSQAARFLLHTVAAGKAKNPDDRPPEEVYDMAIRALTETLRLKGIAAEHDPMHYDALTEIHR